MNQISMKQKQKNQKLLGNCPGKELCKVDSSNQLTQEGFLKEID